MSISERIRPGIEAAPWVCDEVGKLEVSYEAIKIQLAAANERIRELENTLSIAVDTGMGTIAAERAISDKLENALKDIRWQVARFSDADSITEAALAEVAALRKGKPT